MGTMHPVMRGGALAVALMVFAGTNALSQRQNSDCGDAADARELTEWLKPRFLSADITYAEYRAANGLHLS